LDYRTTILPDSFNPTVRQFCDAVTNIRICYHAFSLVSSIICASLERCKAESACSDSSSGPRYQH